MSISSSFIFLPIFLLSLTLSTVSGAVPAVTTTSSPGPLFHFCSNSGNYTAGGAYDKNLISLFRTLSSNVPPTGFGLASTGHGGNRVNGLGLCRGDVNSPDCKTCITEAGKEIKNRCPSNEGGVIWYDNCLVRYSNVKFFGQIDSANRFYMWNINTVNNSATFNQKTRELITNIYNEAYLSPTLFATGEMKLGESETLYGLAQCTRDLSSSDCKKCLADATNELPSCCDAKRGGRVVGGSCNFRYELYPFVNVY